MKVQVMLSIPAMIPPPIPALPEIEKVLKFCSISFKHIILYLQCISKELSIQLKNGPFYFNLTAFYKLGKVVLNGHFEMKFKIFTGKRNSPSYLRLMAE